MLEEINGHWITSELKPPFGRGINFQIDIQDIQSVIDRSTKYYAFQRTYRQQL